MFLFTVADFMHKSCWEDGEPFTTE